MNAAAEARLSELDRVLDAREFTADLAAELFAVADLLTGQTQLRNAVADPTSSADQRRELASAVLGSRVSADAAAVAGEAAALKWGSPANLVAALERQGVRTLFGTAQVAGRLDSVEEELFRFARSVAGSPELRAALDDRNAPVPARQQLIGDLLADRAKPETVALAQRAAAVQTRSFEAVLDEYLKLAAAAQQRALAVVTVAVPLSAAQKARLMAALSRQLGRPVSLQVLIDPAVLGGARVRVGDEVIEGTVAGRLAAAEHELTK